MTTRSDADLVALVADGKTAMYGELYSRHLPLAITEANRADALNAEERKDVVALGFERVYAAIRSGKRPQYFRAYLRRTIRNTAIDMVTGKWHSVIRVGEDDVLLDQLSAKGAETVVVVALSVRATFESLPDRWRTVLWLTAVEGWTCAELSEHLGLSPNACSALTYRARERFKELYSL